MIFPIIFFLPLTCFWSSFSSHVETYSSLSIQRIQSLLAFSAAKFRAAEKSFIHSKKKILSVKYDEVEVHDTYIQTKSGNEIAYYNLLGNRIDKSTIKEDKNEEKEETTNEVTGKLIPKENDDKWGFVDSNSNVVVDYKYEKVTEFNKYGFAGVKLDGKWGSIDENGNVIVEPIYNLDNYYEVEFIGKYYKVVYDYKTVYYSDDKS